MTRTVDFNRPRENAGPPDDPDAFLRQDGLVFGWSDSNVQYEVAWWLYASAPDTPLTRALREERRPAGWDGTPLP